MSRFDICIRKEKHIPKELKTTKRSLEYKEMSWGGFKNDLYMCNLVEGETTKMGLVGWKDWDMVCFLNSDCNTRETDTCLIRTKGGIISSL